MLFSFFEYDIPNGKNNLQKNYIGVGQKMCHGKNRIKAMPSKAQEEGKEAQFYYGGSRG